MIDATEALTTRRLFNNTYDSVAQRDSVEDAVTAHGLWQQRHERPLPPVRELLQLEAQGRARMDVILSGTLVLTDAQLLDGTLLTRIDPATFIRGLRLPELSDTPIEIMVRAPSLIESLLNMVRDPRQDNRAKPFEFSSLSASVAQNAKAHLQDLRAAEASGPSDLPSLIDLLAACGASREDCVRLESTWQSWQDLADAGVLKLTLWSGNYAPDAAIEQASRTAAEERWLYWGYGDATNIRHGLDSDLAKSTFDVAGDMLRAKQNRTDIRTTILQAALGTDELTLLNWLDMVYGFALCNQHGCEDAEFPGSTPLLRPVHETRPTHAERQRMVTDALEELRLTSIELPSDYYMRLAHLSRNTLNAWAEENFKLIEAWRSEYSTAGHALEAAVAALESRMENIYGRGDWWASEITVAIENAGAIQASKRPESLGEKLSRASMRHAGRVGEVIAEETYAMMAVKFVGKATHDYFPEPVIRGAVAVGSAMADLKRRFDSNPPIVTDIGSARRRLGARIMHGR